MSNTFILDRRHDIEVVIFGVVRIAVVRIVVVVVVRIVMG
jgi:hypothetical protein